MSSEDLKEKPRVIITQILYAKNFNSEFEIKFPKHRFKKFIKDVVLGSLERKELIEETISLHLNKDIDIKRTEKLLIILLHAAIFELLYKPQTSVNIIINEYLNAAEAFVDNKQKKFLNALLDKISKKIRNSNE
jgi:N utilization substance protein B|tara:strand:+ start:167 stop:568 length:402 start_codon:yes stop_codon:yes gene_type:complete